MLSSTLASIGFLGLLNSAAAFHVAVPVQAAVSSPSNGNAGTSRNMRKSTSLRMGESVAIIGCRSYKPARYPAGRIDRCVLPGKWKRSDGVVRSRTTTVAAQYGALLS